MIRFGRIQLMVWPPGNPAVVIAFVLDAGHRLAQFPLEPTVSINQCENGLSTPLSSLARFSTRRIILDRNKRMTRVVELYLFDTCTMKCGYCWLAESGNVLDSAQLARFREKAFIDRIVHFFSCRTTATENWNVTLTGGEPLIMPNLPRMCEGLFLRGNQVSFYTSLYVAETQAQFRFLLEHGPAEVDYIMASLHPEAEADEAAYWRKIRLLKNRGHNIFVRFVAHPARFERLPDLAARSKDLDVCFYPTTLLSNRYPARYTESQRDELSRYFSSLSQFIQLMGGLSTHGLRCHAGNRVIAANLRTGDITPCITVKGPSLGNIFENRLELFPGPITCPTPGVNCSCDIHFQQDVVIGAADEGFQSLKKGFAEPRSYQGEIDHLRSSGFAFYGNPEAGIGGVADDDRLMYSIAEVKDTFRHNGHSNYQPPFRVGDSIPHLFRLDEYQRCNESLIDEGPPMVVTTPPGQWHYAALFPCRTTGPEPAVAVRVSAKVLAGMVGVGIVSADKCTYLTKEIFLLPGDTHCDLLSEASLQEAWLVIRNVGAGFTPATVQLHALDAFRVIHE